MISKPKTKWQNSVQCPSTTDEQVRRYQILKITVVKSNEKVLHKQLPLSPPLAPERMLTKEGESSNMTIVSGCSLIPDL